MSKHLLQKGEIFRLENGMKVYAKVPTIKYSKNEFYSSLQEIPLKIGDTFSAKKQKQQILKDIISENIGTLVDLPKDKLSSFVKSLNLAETVFDSSSLSGEYTVTYASSCENDPDTGWHVFCRKNDSSDTEIHFYQTGHSPALIRNIATLDS